MKFYVNKVLTGGNLRKLDDHNFEQTHRFQISLIPAGENIGEEKAFLDKLQNSGILINYQMSICTTLYEKFMFLVDVSHFLKELVPRPEVELEERNHDSDEDDDSERTPAALPRLLVSLFRFIEEEHPTATFEFMLDVQPRITHNLLKHRLSWGFKRALTNAEMEAVTGAVANGQFIESINLSVNIPSSLKRKSEVDLLQAGKRMLLDGLGSDATIKLAGSDKTFKCHKGILMANSILFKTVFEGNSHSALTGSVTIGCMSEESMRAFLLYLYCADLKAAEENCNVAFQLLLASYKFTIPSLEKNVIKLLAAKGVNYEFFTVDHALKILSRIKGNNNYEAKALKINQIQILRGKFSELETSPTFKELSKEDLTDLLKILLQQNV